MENSLTQINHYQNKPTSQQPIQASFKDQSFRLESNNSAIQASIATASLASSSNQQPRPLPQLPTSLQQAAQQSQSPYQFKCNLLEYHIHEAVLVNKALRSELQEYREKIAFEKKLRSVLIDRLKNFSSRKAPC